MSFEEGFAVGLKLREKMDEAAKNRKATEIFNKYYKPQEMQAEQIIPNSYTKKDPMAIVEGFKKSNEDEVTTSPLRQEPPIVEGFATTPVPEDRTRIEKTSPFNTYDEKGMESPADMPYGFGAIPQESQPMETNVAPMATQETSISPMPPVANTTTTPQETSFYQKTVQDVTEAQNKVNKHQQELTKIRNVADEMRSQGLWKEAENYETKAVDAQKNIYESTNEYYKTVSKALDFRAGLADSYLNAVEGGANPDWAWNQVIMRANKLGIPDMDQYANLKGEQRTQFAQMVKDEAMSTKDRLKSDLEIMKEENKKQRFNRNLAFKQETNTLKDRWHAEDKALKSRSLDIKEVTANFNMSNKMVSNLRSDLKAKEARLADIRSGKFIKDEFGVILTPVESQREATLLTQEIKDTQERLEAAEKHTDAYRQVLPKSEQNKLEKEAKAEESSSKISESDINLVIKAINTNPGALDIIRKNFEELHPGLKLEDYVKLNTPGKESVDTRETLKSFEGSPNRIKVDVTKSSKPIEKTYKDPITGERISQAEFRKKYGENPK